MPPPLNRDYIKDPDTKALKRRGGSLIRGLHYHQHYHQQHHHNYLILSSTSQYSLSMWLETISKLLKFLLTTDYNVEHNEKR